MTNRSAGVTASAIIALLGSALTLLFGLAAVAMSVIVSRLLSTSADPTMPPARSPTALLVGAALFYLLPGVWGLVTGIGLMRLRNWARISTIVFAVLLILGSVFIGVTVLVMSAWAQRPTTDQTDAAAVVAALRVARGVMLVMAAGAAALGTWWVIFFTRPKVALQFTGGATDQAGATPRRPVSITIIAWLMLVGSPFLLVSIAMRSPVPFFVMTLTGAPAAAFSLAICAVLLYGGIGLLRLRPTARIVSMAYFVFGILNSAVYFLTPGGPARFTALMERSQAMMPFPSPDPRPMPFDPTTLIYVSMAIGLIFTAVTLYFLATRKQAFKAQENHEAVKQ